MSTPTPELGLQQGVDSDDTADYLTINLASSLVTIDSLFNQVAGHTHAGAHQGGPIAPGSISGPYDWPDWFRSTGHTSPFATSQPGLELYYDATQGAVVQGYNRASAEYVTLNLNGSTIVCNADQTVTMVSSLTVGGPLTANGGLGTTTLTTSGNAVLATLNVSGAMTVGSFITMPDSTGIDWTDGNTRLWTVARNFYFDSWNAWFYWRNTAAGDAQQMALDPSGNLTVATVDATGNHYYFGGNTGIFVEWTGTYIQTSHSLVLGGNNLYFANNAGIFVEWTGTYIQTSHSLMIGGTTLAFGGNTTANISWSGTQMVFATQVLHNAPIVLPTNVVLTLNGDPNSGMRIWSDNTSIYLASSGGLQVRNAGNTSNFTQVSASAFNVNSSLQNKANVRDIDSPTPIEIVANPALHGIVYEYGDAAITMVGFDAEAWYPIVPAVVTTDANGDVEAMNYGSVGAIVFEALKDYMTQTDARLAALEAA
jgi:hypothetical protein